MSGKRLFIVVLVMGLLLPISSQAQSIDWLFRSDWSSNLVQSFGSGGVTSQDTTIPDAFVDVIIPGIYEVQGEVSGWGTRDLYSSTSSDFYGGLTYNSAGAEASTTSSWEFSYDSATDMTLDYTITPETFSIGDYSQGGAEARVLVGSTDPLNNLIYVYNYTVDQDSTIENVSGSTTFYYDPSFTYYLELQLSTSSGWITADEEGEGHAQVTYTLNSNISPQDSGATPVPEPVSSSMFLMGATILGLKLRKNKIIRVE